jgi:hypothetical protein
MTQVIINSVIIWLCLQLPFGMIVGTWLKNASFGGR